MRYIIYINYNDNLRDVISLGLWLQGYRSPFPNQDRWHSIMSWKFILIDTEFKRFLFDDVSHGGREELTYPDEFYMQGWEFADGIGTFQGKEYRINLT